MITFRNKGLIEKSAITVMGVSSKDGARPIGYFGTGLKYAISVILRLGGEITIWRGHEPLIFTKESTRIRNDDFDIVHMNDCALGFTTHLGVNWEVWQAFRELYCNTLDEGGMTTDMADVPPTDDHTTICVDGLPGFEQAYRERGQIVLQSKPLFVAGQIEVHPGSSQYVYYRGIRAGQLNDPSPFTYNLVGTHQLTEDRTLKYTFMIDAAICQAVLHSSDPAFLEAWLSAPTNSYEHKLDLLNGDDTPEETFLDAVLLAGATCPHMINSSAIALLTRARGRGLDYAPVELDELEQCQLDKARAAAKAMGYDIDKFPVLVVSSLGTGISGLAQRKEKRILLSRRAFEIGTKHVAGTLVEEFLHLEFLYEDCSRDFQNYLIDKMMTMVERHVLKELL